MSDSSPYVSRKEVNESYRPKGYGLSPGMKRARAQFRVRNALTGMAIASFAVGVWAYSISAVKQDNFEDVDEEARALVQSRQRSLEAAKKTARPATPIIVVEGQDGAAVQAVAPPPNSSSHTGPVHPSTEVGGILHKYLPSQYRDPVRGTFVWGAPPVDRIGRISDISDKSS